jgi:glutathione S-transferase
MRRRIEELVVPMFDADWEERREGDERPRRQVPIRDGDIVVWDSLATSSSSLTAMAPLTGLRMRRERCAIHVGRDSGNLRRELPMNVRLPPATDRAGPRSPDPTVVAVRVRFGGAGNFRSATGALWMMYAPAVTRLITYGVAIPNFAAVYMKSVLSHPDAAERSTKPGRALVIDQYEWKGRQASRIGVPSRARIRPRSSIISMSE